MRINTLNIRVSVGCAVFIGAAAEILVKFDDQYVNERRITQL